MFVSVFAVRGILDQVARQHIPAELVLRGSPVTSSDLADMRTLVGADDFEHIVQRAAELTQDPCLGLSVGSEAPESTFQIITYLALSVPTMRQAFELLQRYCPLFVDALEMSVAERDGVAEFRFAFHRAITPELARFGAECLAAFSYRLAATHFTEGKRPHYVRFKHARPKHGERYERVFGCTVEFDASYNSIFFDASSLDRVQHHADTSMAYVLRTAAEEMLRTFGAPLSTADRLRALLRREPNLCSADLHRFATRLGMTARSLRRQLANEGLTFSHIRNEARVYVAQAELLRPGSCIKDVGERLGYSETTAFHRAFKRYTGKTPVEYIRSMSRTQGHELLPSLR